jgi:tRNA G18 (ribose-2'-O)-methylase SpoU
MLVEKLSEAGYSTYWTGAQATASITELPKDKKLAIFLGSEGRGLDSRQRETIGPGVKIMTAPEVESLNATVAGSIVAYELARQPG